MRRRDVRMGAVALALAMLVAGPLGAQQQPDETRSSSGAWLARVSIAARYGELRPTGHSGLFSLLDRAQTPGTKALRPFLAGGELQVRVIEDWELLVGIEAGERTIGSVSRVQPASNANDVRQQTSLELTAVHYLGAQWQVLRWRGASPEATDRTRILLGAGGGTAHYRLRQWGNFVDVERGVVFEDDFLSSGRGVFGYVSATLEVPLRRWIALQGELRRQAGSAPMTADYAEFDRLDLGGTKLSAGVRLRPFGAH